MGAARRQIMVMPTYINNEDRKQEEDQEDDRNGLHRVQRSQTEFAKYIVTINWQKVAQELEPSNT